MPQYDEVDWSEAECRRLEIYTDLFYSVEEERSQVAYEYINSLRSVCASCPIWKTCLTYAMEHEHYGVWGGMTTQERISMRHPDKYPNQRARALFAFQELGISYTQIMECLEDK